LISRTHRHSSESWNLSFLLPPEPLANCASRSHKVAMIGQLHARVAALGFGLAMLGCTAGAQAPAPAAQRQVPMAARAQGSFEVKLAPQPAPEGGEAVGRMLIDKQFHGPLQAVSRGQMLAFQDKAGGSAAYVALEQVTGTLDGRKGSFILMHNGTMTRDGQHLLVTVAPGSGSGELAGLSGEMKIKITGGKHLYDFTYRLP
jgi:hypothetical protein